MAQTITAIKARQNLGDLLNRVLLRRDEFIIKRGEHSMAAVIPLEKFELLQKAARGYLLQYMEEAHTINRRHSSPGADEKLLDTVKHRARQVTPRRRTA